MRLYAYWRSSCSYRARIALALKGLSVEIVSVPLLDGEQMQAGFTAKNPSQQVPVLELDDGTLLGQSIAIMEYLDEVHPEPPILPRDPVARARCRQLTEVINSGVQPMQNHYVLTRLREEHGVDAKVHSIHFIDRGLRAYEALAERTAGAFSVGDTPTIADCALVPQLYNARRFGMDVAKDYPRLHAIDARCAELEAFQVAHPDRQPDAPSEGER